MYFDFDLGFSNHGNSTYKYLHTVWITQSRNIWTIYIWNFYFDALFLIIRRTKEV